jgi:hypothetical protein
MNMNEQLTIESTSFHKTFYSGDFQHLPDKHRGHGNDPPRIQGVTLSTATWRQQH